LAGLLVGVIPLPPSIILLRRWYPSRYGDPYQPLRIIGRILPKQQSDRSALISGFAIHLLVSAVLGAGFTTTVDRLAGRTFARRAALGAALGTAQWVVTYYGFLSWYYPAQLRADPPWVAASTHAGFGAAVAVIT
jgi:hypothetical protein